MSQSFLPSINPATGQQIESYAETGITEACDIAQQVDAAQKTWAKTSLSIRINCIMKLHETLLRDIEEHARLITVETGKPITQSRQEIEKCASLCTYYKRAAPEVLAPTEVATDYIRSYYRPEPMGVILAIMPWNFPYWQVFRAAVPILLAGNGLILKHASNVSGCSLAIEAVFKKAGFPEDILRSVIMRGSAVSVLVSHPAVCGITLTGSQEAGEKTAALAGSQIKKTVIELGGSDPFIVLSDANLELAADRCALGRLLNAGQSCIAAKRIFVHESVHERFVAKLKASMQAFVPGDPMDRETRMGPLISEEARKTLHSQITQSVEMGAHCEMGGYLHDGPGFLYPPTLLTAATPGMPVFDEETFGPVACVCSFSSDDELLTLANNTQLGLACAVFGEDRDRAIAIAESLSSGTCAINDFVKSDPRLPFGGTRKSGYGRELGPQGLLEFTNIRSYNIA